MALADYVQGSAGRGSALVPTSSSLKPVLTNTKVAAPKKAGTVSTPTKTTVVKPPPAAPNYATLMAQAATSASKLAAQQIAAQVKAITDQQTQLHQTATAQAAEINRASMAAAQFLSGLGDMTKSDYTAAVQNLGGMAQGYTGALRDTAQQAADAAQAQLSSIPGNEQTAVNRGNDLANLVYGVSGQIPANALAVQGLGATELARAIPQQELSYGQQQAIGQLGAGNKAADALNAQIATIRATLPTTTSTYLSTFEKTAQDQITNARNARIDALNVKKTNASIAATKATGKRLTKAAADKAKADAAKLLVPDATQTKLAGGILTSAGGKPITKTIKGVQFLQTAPGYHFDTTGRPVPDPKPTDPAKIDALALQWSTHLHYRADSAGNALLFHGKKQPLAPYILDPNDPTGQTVMPRTAAAKAFVPKPDKLLSASAKALVYIGEDGQPHFFKQADGVTNFPYDPTKPVQLQAKNSGGVWVVFDPSTGEWNSAHDDNGTPLIAGTPKGPATIHYGPTKILANGNLAIFDPTQVRFVDTGQKAYQKPTAASRPTIVGSATTGYYGLYPDGTTKLLVAASPTAQKPQIVGSDKSGRWIVRINPGGKVTKTLLIPPVKGAAAAGAATAALNKPLTRSELIHYTSRINAGLKLATTGIDPKTGKRTHRILDRLEAIKELRLAHYFRSPPLAALAMELVNKYYPQVQSKGPLGVTGAAVPDVPPG